MTRVGDLVAIRHLEDHNALLSYGTDAPLKTGQQALVVRAVDELVAGTPDRVQAEFELIFSPSRRTRGTADLLSAEILARCRDVSITFTSDNRLTDLSQGAFRFPAGYQDGMHLDGLSLAWEVFWDQAFSQDNLLYRFGDPLTRPDGSTEHPRLESTFLDLGESCASYTHRFYSFLASLPNRRRENVTPVLIAHTATIFILYEFMELSRDVQLGLLPRIPAGTLPRLTWSYLERVKKRVPEHPIPGSVHRYPLRRLVCPAIQELIRRDRDVLKAQLIQSGN